MNILIKNMLDCLIGAMAYWSIGWGLAYGPGGSGGFAGGSQFFAIGMEASDYPSWFFQVVCVCLFEIKNVINLQCDPSRCSIGCGDEKALKLLFRFV